MDFSIPKHFTTGVLSGEDLQFFYYDICLDNFQDWPLIYDWDSVVAEFDSILDIDACTTAKIPQDFIPNQIRFTLSNKDKNSKSAAFFRHLRNAFAHYHVTREGDNFVLTDNAKNITMRGLVNAELLKTFCFRFFDFRENIINGYENFNDTLNTNNLT